MDSLKSDNAAKIPLLFNQANEAFDRGDKRTSAMLIHTILSQEITHNGAWRLLYMMLGGNQPFNEFQLAFAQKYYPAQAHQLAAPINTPTTSYINDGIQAVSPFTRDNQNEVRFCPSCGHERTAGSLFCNRCGLQFGSGGGSTAYPAAHAPLPARESSPPPVTTSTNLFTPKRVVAAIGLLIILLSGIFTWYTAVDVELFTPDSFTHIGLTTPAGIFSSVFALLGFIALFTTRKESPAARSAATAAFMSGLAALIFILSENWSNTPSMAYSKLGAGPLAVFVGTAIALSSIFVAPQQQPDPTPTRGGRNSKSGQAHPEWEPDTSTAYRLGALLREDWSTILFASIIYASAISIVSYTTGWLTNMGMPLFLCILINLLPFPLFILYLNNFRLNRHFFLSFLNPNAFPLITTYIFMRQVFPTGVLGIISWLMNLSGLVLWMFLAFLFDLPELKLKRGLIWAGFYILRIVAGMLLQALSLSYSPFTTFVWIGISFSMGIGLAIGYLLYPFAYQTKTK